MVLICSVEEYIVLCGVWTLDWIDMNLNLMLFVFFFSYFIGVYIFILDFLTFLAFLKLILRAT